MQLVQSFFGGIALATSFVGLLPQSFKAFKTRSTHDVSMLMLINYTCCSIAWVVYGYCIDASFVIMSNIVGLLSCILLIAQKIYYDNQPS
jgi:MtN3 and saliva related transmembrane protein